MKKEKKSLIPFEKSKKVIYLDRRGRTRRKISVGSVAAGIFGTLCLLYCVGIAIAGFGTYFFLIWGVLGAALLVLSAALSNSDLISRLPLWLKRTAAVLALLGGGLFCLVEGMIFTQFYAYPEPGADYVVILGAQWKPEGPSEVLRRRLDAAVQYLDRNPDTMAVVSGGRGSNEPVSEAAGMRQYLIESGIDDDRILMEDQSANTLENLVFSGKFLEKEKDRVVIVTNNFHMFRALRIAEKQGYGRAEGLAASSVRSFLPNNMLREFLGVVKDYLVGNL